MIRRLSPISAALVVTMTMAVASAQDALDASARTVIGPNVLLADGAQAMLNGDWERGIQLTQLGLSVTHSREDRAAALSNLCAGYGALKKYERALESCNESLALLDSNWRTWQNRAAANLGLGRIEESLKDIQRGLELNPQSTELQKTLAIARDREKAERERLKDLVES
ncbi:MAG TPA: hypothetical protein VF193_14325 [Steroidobacter sp.]